MADNKGRIEHQIKEENILKNLIKDLPDYVKGFYYSLSTLGYRTKSVYVHSVYNYLTVLKANGVDITDPANLNLDNTNMYFNEIQYTARSGGKKKSSISLINTRWSSLNSFFKFMVASDRVKKNPMDNIKRARGRDNVKRVYMQPEDISKVMDKVQAEIDKRNGWRAVRNKAIVTILISTGIRATALTEIDVNHIEIVTDENNNVTGVALNIIDKENTYYKRYLSANAAKSLIDWLNRREMLVEEAGSDTNAVFINKDMERMTVFGIEKVIKKYSPVINGKQITPHKYRATYGTLLYKQTKDIYYVQKQMKHASPTTTEIYVVNDEADEMRATGIMDEIVFG